MCWFQPTPSSRLPTVAHQSTNCQNYLLTLPLDCAKWPGPSQQVSSRDAKYPTVLEGKSTRSGTFTPSSARHSQQAFQLRLCLSLSLPLFSHREISLVLGLYKKVNGFSPSAQNSLT